MPADSIPEELSEQVRHHITDVLRLKSVEAYLGWCREHHFSCHVKKTAHQMKSEREFFLAFAAERVLKKSRGVRNPVQAIDRIFEGELGENDLNDDSLIIIALACRKQKAAPKLHSFLSHLAACSKLLTEKRYAIGVLNLQHFQDRWIRDAEEWKPRTHNICRQFSDLARHLLSGYPVPVFMDEVWFGKNRTRQKWFIHIGRGENIRAAAGLPFPLTKKMAHFFMQAPDNYSPLSALRFGQVCALGGDRRIMDALLPTHAVRDFRDNEFTLELFRFFVRNPMLDTVHYHPLIDFIWNQKYENRAVFVERGVAEEQGPPQPGFSLKGRTPETLLKNMEDWHRQLGRSARGGVFQWVKSFIPDYEHIEGRKEKQNMLVWRITELLSSKELEEEGKALGHCVATYAVSCYRRASSIWSMTCETSAGLKRLLTVEVRLKAKEIVQARGLRNRLPEPKEDAIIRRWAAKEGLAFEEGAFQR